MSASSSGGHGLLPGNARVNQTLGRGGWCSLYKNNLSDYLQIDFGENVTITQVAVQRRFSIGSNYVSQFELQSSYDGISYHTYKGQGSNNYVSCHCVSYV